MHGNRRTSIPVVLLISALSILLVGCGDDDGASTTTTTTDRTTTSSTAPPDDVTEARAYLLREELLAPVAREATGDAVASSMEGLLEGPTQEEQELGFATAIPDGTELLGVEVADGTATVDLSAEFGAGGGSASMMGRVAQVVFTLTQFPTVDSVLFEIDGAPVDALGGEGLLLDEPQTRVAWQALVPPVMVESPLPFSEVSSPLEISGTVNGFEAALQVNVTDGEGLIVYDEPAVATSTEQMLGTFDVTATFEVPRPGVGEVIVFDTSDREATLVEVPILISGLNIHAS